MDRRLMGSEQRERRQGAEHELVVSQCLNVLLLACSCRLAGVHTACCCVVSAICERVALCVCR